MNLHALLRSTAVTLTPAPSVHINFACLCSDTGCHLVNQDSCTESEVDPLKGKSTVAQLASTVLQPVVI